MMEAPRKEDGTAHAHLSSVSNEAYTPGYLPPKDITEEERAHKLHLFKINFGSEGKMLNV